ncbi:hypothetical protein [Bradyrhizobium sp. JR18.2]
MAFVATKRHQEADVSSVDKLVLATVNAPFKRDISAAELQECIERAYLGAWSVHVAAFFIDVSQHLVLSFAAGLGISKSQLAEAYLAMKAKTGERNLDLESEFFPSRT